MKGVGRRKKNHMKPRKIEGRIKKEENDFIGTYLGFLGEDLLGG